MDARGSHGECGLSDWVVVGVLWGLRLVWLAHLRGSGQGWGWGVTGARREVTRPI